MEPMNLSDKWVANDTSYPNSTLYTDLETTSSVYPSSQDEFTKIATIVIPVVYSVITALGLVGNSLIIIVILINRTMKEGSTYWLILSLAIADLFFILICVPFTAVRFASEVWIFGDTWCRIVYYLTNVCSWVSAYTLVLMCIDRLIAVVFAIQLPYIRSRRNVTIAVVTIWVVIALANIPTWMFHGEYTYNHAGIIPRKTCKFLTENFDQSVQKTFQLSNFAFGFMLPVLAMIIMYSILVSTLMKRSIAGSISKSASQKSTRRVTIIVTTVVSVYIICWLPIQVILVMFYTIGYTQSEGHIAVMLAAGCLAYMNSCLNPILYTISSTIFRKEFVKFFLLLCRACRKKTDKQADTMKNADRNAATQIISLSNSKTLSTSENSGNGNSNAEKVPFLTENTPPES